MRTFPEVTSESAATARVVGRRAGRAVVIGGSIAGLVASRILSDHFSEVIVLERDELPDKPEPRRGVPQAHHYHGLLARGMRVLEELFPNFSGDMESYGAQVVSATEDLQVRRRIGWLPHFPSSLEVLLASRALIEWAIRVRVNELDNVTILSAHNVVRLLATDDSSRVTGVLVSTGGSQEPDRLDADLVVDASGRASAAPKWLEELGYGAVEETSVNAHWGYSSCFVRLPDDHRMKFKAISAAPLNGLEQGARRTRGAAMWIQEGERRYILTAIGSANDHPPSNFEGLLEFVRGLDYEELTEALRDVAPLGEVYTWRRMPNRLRHFEALRRRPEAFVCVGDSVAAFNPVYGQGMTVALLGANGLDAELRAQASLSGAGEASLDGLAERFHRHLFNIVQVPWTLAISSDYRVEGVNAPPRPPEASRLTAYFDRIEALAADDPEVMLAYLETAHLLRDPAWMTSDSMRRRILDDWEQLGHRVGSNDPVPAA
jgi:2-polyprenyl-6-methoxyphenol hydroxylase-like FAD-dependent oxidoreductase